MKELVRFWKDATLKNRLKILRTIFDISAGVFHEVCHILMICILFQKINYIKCLHFYDVEKTETGRTLHSFSFQVQHTYKTKIGNVLTSIAPLIGIVLSPLISPYLFIYLLLAYNGSFLSSLDYSNIKRALRPNQVKLSKVLNKLEKVIAPNR